MTTTSNTAPSQAPSSQGPTQTPAAPTMANQAQLLLPLVAGYVGHRAVAMGLRSGLIGALAEAAPGGATADDLADRLGLDPFYVAVWCRAAFAAGICDREDRTAGWRHTWRPCCSTTPRRGAVGARAVTRDL